MTREYQLDVWEHILRDGTQDRYLLEWSSTVITSVMVMIMRMNEWS